jgi:hypothetical protein
MERVTDFGEDWNNNCSSLNTAYTDLYIYDLYTDRFRENWNKCEQLFESLLLHEKQRLLPIRFAIRRMGWSRIIKSCKRRNTRRLKIIEPSQPAISQTDLENVNKLTIQPGVILMKMEDVLTQLTVKMDNLKVINNDTRTIKINTLIKKSKPKKTEVANFRPNITTIVEEQPRTSTPKITVTKISTRTRSPSITQDHKRIRSGPTITEISVPDTVNTNFGINTSFNSEEEDLLLNNEESREIGSDTNLFDLSEHEVDNLLDTTNVLSESTDQGVPLSPGLVIPMPTENTFTNDSDEETENIGPSMREITNRSRITNNIFVGTKSDKRERSVSTDSPNKMVSTSFGVNSTPVRRPASNNSNNSFANVRVTHVKKQ